MNDPAILTELRRETDKLLANIAKQGALLEQIRRDNEQALRRERELRDKMNQTKGQRK